MSDARDSVENKKDHEGEAMIEEFEAREAGVAELAALYDRIEAIYVEASQTLLADPPTIVSDAANPTR